MNIKHYFKVRKPKKKNPLYCKPKTLEYKFKAIYINLWILYYIIVFNFYNLYIHIFMKTISYYIYIKR